MLANNSMVLDLMFGWVLAFDLWIAIFILAFLITLLMTLVYKWATDQNEMKRLKKQLKDLQKKMREQRENPKKVMQLQKKLMSINMEYMKKSIKPTLYTIIPLLFVFMWMNAAFSLEPIAPQQEFSVTAYMQAPDRVTLESSSLSLLSSEATRETVESQASWRLSGPAGEHSVSFVSSEGDVAEHPVFIDMRPQEPELSQDNPFVRTEVGYAKATPFGDFSVFGYNPGWLFTYILFSIVFSIGLRKLMKLS